MKLTFKFCAYSLISGLGATFVTIGLCKIYNYRKRYKRRKAYPKDVVVLHQLEHGFKSPSLCAFTLKLETWLRMTEIKYEVEFHRKTYSTYEITPWITLNNIDIHGSQFCNHYLGEKFGKDLSDFLTQVEKSVARALRKMCEESLRWPILIHRFKYGKPKDIGVSRLYFYIYGRKVLRDANRQGYGRHTKNEVYEIGMSDMTALNDFIGNKKFLFGNQPCEEDASIFAFTCQIAYHDNGPLNEHLLKNCKNLLNHMDKIKELYWSDWNDRIGLMAQLSKLDLLLP